MLKTLGKTTWDKIEIGEIFAFEGCWSIFEKVNDKQARFLESDEDWKIFGINNERGQIVNYNEEGGFSNPSTNFRWDVPFGCLTKCNFEKTNEYLYKLSESIQKLWKTN